MTPEAVEALILEGFLSYDDLGNCIEAEELAEIAGVTVEQAQEMTEFAEQKAEELGEEAARTPRTAVDHEGRPLAVAKPNPAAEAYKVLGGQPTVSSEARQTFQDLFRDKPESPAETGEPAAPVEHQQEETAAPPAEEAPAAEPQPEPAPALVEQGVGEAAPPPEGQP